MGQLCELQGVEVYQEFEPTLLAGIRGNMERVLEASGEDGEEEHSTLAEKIQQGHSSTGDGEAEMVSALVGVVRAPLSVSLRGSTILKEAA